MKYMSLKLNNLFLLIFILSINLEAKLNKSEENFVDVFYRYGDCNNSYYKFVNSDKKIKQYLLNEETKADFEIKNLSEFDLNFFKKKIISYCNPSEIFKDAKIDLEEILSSDSINKSFLLTTHLHSLLIGMAMYNPDNVRDKYDVISYTLGSVLGTYESFNTSNNWSYSITSLYNLVESVTLSEFSDFYNEDYKNQNYQNYLFYDALESIILQSINPFISEDSINFIAKILMQTRIEKIKQNRLFGTSANDYLLKEEFLSLYLNKYEDQKIKYTEFSNIFFDKFSDSKTSDFIELNIDLDELEDLIQLSVDKSSTLLTSNSEIQYVERILDIVSDKFYENPERVISMSYYSINLLSNNSIKTCSFNDKQIKEKNSIEFYDLVTKLNFYKFTCSQDLEFLRTILIDLKKGLSLIQNNSVDLVSDSIHDEYIMNLFILMTASLSFIDSSDLRKRMLDLDFKNFIDLLEKALNKYKRKTINNTDELLYIGMFMTLETMLDVFYLEDKPLQAELDNYKKTLFTKFPFDFNKVKNEFNKLIENIDSDNINEIFMTARFAQFYPGIFINKYYDENTYFWPENIINDLSKYEIEDTEYKYLIESLDLLSFVIDNLNKIFKGPDDFLFIFKNQSLDKWYLYRDLVPTEIYLKYVLWSSNKINFDEYIAHTENRANQLIKIRPNNIALQKFRNNIIDSDYHKPITKYIQQYDEAHKFYNSIVDAQHILSSNTQEYVKQDIKEFKSEYKSKLLDIEDILFSDEYKEYLPSLFRFESHDISHLQKLLKDDEIIVSVITQPGGSMSFANYITNTQLITLPVFEDIEAYSHNLLEKFQNPKSDNYIWLARNLYYNILSPIEEILGSYKTFKNIYVVADTGLQKTPFHALYDPKNNVWSIEKYNFKYLSSEKLFLYLDNHQISRSDNFFGIGNPSLNKKTIKSEVEKFFNKRSEIGIKNLKELYELPETEEELKYISNFFNARKLFFQDDATEDMLYSDLFLKSDVMAFATHAVRGVDVNSNYNDRGIVLTPVDEFNITNDGFVGSLDIGGLTFKSEPLVMLSACNTIDSPYFDSLPFSGLPKSFMNAGANSVLMSLWNIDSFSAQKFNESLFDKSFFTRNFYISESIQESMIEMINSKDYSHPYYWAPYLYLGK